MNSMPRELIRYSFLMCVNKLTPFLDRAVQSVLNQTFADFDFYIIANNCSEELWEALQSYSDPRIKLHRTSIGQLSFNLNFGLNLIGEGYALRMDADDISMPDRLEVTRTMLQSLNYPDVLGGNALLIDENDNEIGTVRVDQDDHSIRSALWKKCPMIHPTCAIKVNSILRLRGYLGGFMSEDYDLWLRAARDKEFVFRNSGVVFLKYRISQGQARGSFIGYSEVAGSMLREFLISPGVKYFAAVVLAVAKRFVRSKK